MNRHDAECPARCTVEPGTPRERQWLRPEYSAVSRPTVMRAFPYQESPVRTSAPLHNSFERPCLSLQKFFCPPRQRRSDQEADFLEEGCQHDADGALRVQVPVDHIQDDKQPPQVHQHSGERSGQQHQRQPKWLHGPPSYQRRLFSHRTPAAREFRSVHPR